jgi:hypothetical protein
MLYRSITDVCFGREGCGVGANYVGETNYESGVASGGNSRPIGQIDLHVALS